MQPSPRAFVIAGCGFAFAILPVLVSARAWWLWLFWCAAVLLAMGIDALLAPAPRRLELEVKAPEQVGVGDPLELTVTLPQLPGGLTDVWVLLEGRGVVSLPGPRHLRVPAEPLRLELPTTKRGRLRIMRAWLRYAGPLGLVRRTKSFEPKLVVRVAPNIDRVRGQALGYFQSRDRRLGLRVERYRGEGSEFDTLREFLPGMDHRSIDWKASARHLSLLARKYRVEQNREIVLAIDTGRLMAEPLDGLPRLDHALHAGLLLAFFGARGGDKVRLFRFGAKPEGLSAPCSGRTGFQQLASMLGEIDYSDDETNFTWGLTDLTTRLSRRTLVIVLTDFADSIGGELIQENVQRLAERHLVVFVTFRDPLLSDLAEREPATLGDLNRAIGADELARERFAVLATLRRRGIFCLDSQPANVGVQLVNRYLEIKRRELI